MSYKDSFYAKYYSTHILERKGEVTLQEFKSRASYFQQRWKGFFPANKEAQMIDIGCGNGSLVWWLQQSGYRQIEGIDVSLEQVAVAQKLGVQNIYQADLKTYLADKQCKYDIIVLPRLSRTFYA